jgi:hypothetical protein
METSSRPCSGKSSGLAFGAAGKGEARTAPLEGTEAEATAFIVEQSRVCVEITDVQTNEPPYADPHVRWCGRGEAAKLPPIPIWICSGRASGFTVLAGGHRGQRP